MTGFDENAHEQLQALSEDLDRALGQTASLSDELGDMEKHIRKLSRGIDRGLKGALEGLVFEGQALSSVMKDLAGSIVRSTFNAGISPVTKHISGLIAGQIEGLIHGANPFAKGAAFSQGSVVPFARGGVVDQATTFPMNGGLGVMGEAGPEAIMPLQRGADGRLGVRASGGHRPINVTINVTTPDVEGFAKSRSQIAAQMSRLLAQGARNR